MALYRNIHMNFWTDSKVVDDFTPEDRYIYLYCMTNPHTNMSGCYEVSIKQIANETGYNADTIERLLKRLDGTHNVIRYSASTKELLLLNWSRYNWSRSEKLDKPILAEIRSVKRDSFREFLADRYNERETVNVQYDPAADAREPFQAEEAASTVSASTPKRKPAATKETHKYGQYGWVKLSDDEHDRLLNDLGSEELERCIAYLDESAQGNHNKNKWSDWNVVVRKCSRQGWGLEDRRGSSAAPRPSKAEGAMDDLRTLHGIFSEEGEA